MADTFNASKHDFGVTYSGVVKGMMLVQKEGVPQWAEYDDEYLATQFFTGEPSAVNLPPEREISFIRADHRSGFGEDVYDSSDPKRYFSSIGCDLRHKDRAMLSWKATAITTLPSTSAKTILNSSFEGWNNGDCDNWTLVDATLTKMTAGGNDGTNYIDLRTAGYVWQNLNTTEIQGRRFTFTAYAYTNGADRGRIAIDDGFTTTYSAYPVGDSAWHQLSVTVTLAQNATRLRLICEVDGSLFIYFDGLMACERVAYTNPTAHAFFNDINYVAFGGLLTKEDSNGDEFEAVYEFASPITSMEVFADGKMYIAQESTQVIEDCEDEWVAGTAKTTVTLDTGDYKIGSGSAKLVYDGTGANGDILAYEDISSLDLTTFTGIKLWIKVSSAVAASDLTLILAKANALASITETIALPAITAGKWTRVYARLADPSDCSAILSVGLEYNANEKENTIHLDDIKAESSYWYMDTGESFTQSDLDVVSHDSFAKYFQPVGLTMWKHLPPHKLYSSLDPSNIGAANWSGVTNVDTPTYDILKLLSDGSTLVIKKQDRAFYLDGTGNVQILIEEMKHLAGETTGASGFYWQGKYYFGAGAQSLIEYDDGTISWRSPSKYSTNLSTFAGKILAITGDEEYLIAIIDKSGSTIEILFGRMETIDGNTKWVWHPYQELTLTGCEIAFVVNDYQKRLYLGSTDSAQGFYSIPLPTGYGDIASDANKSFPTTGTQYFEEPKIDLNFRSDDKTFIKIVAELEHSWDTNIYWECWAKIEDGSYVDVGDLKGSASTRIATLYLAANTTGRNMRLKFVGKTNAVSKTPILLWYDVRAILYAPKRKYFVAQVYCAEKIADRAGNQTTTTIAELSTYLNAARDATAPVSIRDPWGATKTVKFLGSKATPALTISSAHKGKNKEKIYSLIMVEVTIS